MQTLNQPSFSTLNYYTLIVGGAVSFLASLGVFFLSNKLTAPITSLSLSSEKISHGEFGTQVKVSSDDEVGLLTKNINVMSRQLHELQLDKKRSAAQLESKVAARITGVQLMHDRLENIIQTSSQGFWRVDNDMLTKEINPRMAEILNCKQEEVVGRSIMDFVGIPNKTILHKQIHMGRNLLSTEYDIELKQKGGTFIPCLFNATPLLNEQGNKDGSFVMVTDISVLKQTEKHLQEAKRMAEHASHAKSSFLANMSHEIRTPLNGIIGSLELLQDENLSPSKQKQFMEAAQESADFLLILLNDILDLAKIEADKVEMEEVTAIPETT
jgi:PAS domain S-box-containing protein